MSHSAKRNCGTSDLSVLRDVSVLVVEDNWQVAKALECALKQLEMQVSGPASTTSDAKRLVAAQMPRVAIVDVNLKREMACDLIVELHEKGVHVIVISGYAIPAAGWLRAYLREGSQSRLRRRKSLNCRLPSSCLMPYCSWYLPAT